MTASMDEKYDNLGDALDAAMRTALRTSETHTGISDTERTAAATYGAIDKHRHTKGGKRYGARCIDCDTWAEDCDQQVAAASATAVAELIDTMNQQQLRERVLTAARMLVDAYDEGYEDWCLWDGLREAVRQEMAR